MDEYGNSSSWRRVDLAPGYPRLDSERISYVEPLYMLAGGQIIIFKVDPSGRFVMYDMSAETYLIMEKPAFEEMNCKIYHFVQSICSLSV